MSIRKDKLTVQGVMPDGADPLPRFRRMTGFGVYKTGEDFPQSIAEDLGSCTLTMPYRIQNRYDRNRKTLTLDTIVIENAYLRAEFLPCLGGKMRSLYDKERNRELLFANPVIQPCNLAIRDAWTSGGIEWCFGSLGHTYFSCDDVWAAILKEDDGEEFLRIYEFERAKECIWQADFHLPEDSRRIFVHVRLINPNDTDKTTYWWTNVAIPEDGKTRVLSSAEKVIAICGSNLTYEDLPYLSVMPGDLSYPENASRAFDYFFQPEVDVKTTWEGSVNKDGYAFYDRSNHPLIYHKLFGWGNHRGGKRWQQYLSGGENGYYIELQAGIARSQMHDKIFPKNSVMEWTQCFGGAYADPEKIHGVSLDEADAEFGRIVDSYITEEELLSFDAKYKLCADIKTEERDIVHRAGGWGALENLRREYCGEKKLPESVCFPSDSVGDEQKEWIGLLSSGKMELTDPDAIPLSWMTSDKWMKLFKKRDNWTAHLHYGNMLFEYWDNSVTANKALNWDKAGEYEKLAEAEWLKSDQCEPNVWAKRNLAILYRLRGENERAEKYYDEIFEMKASLCDRCFAAEYMSYLVSLGKYEKALELYKDLTPELQDIDRIVISAAFCALKQNELDFVGRVLNREFADVREGETSLTDIWFEYHARSYSLKNGIDFEAEKEKLLEMAEKDHPAPDGIDFRMSYDKNKKYRKT